jgi:hypothetical protein
MSHHHDPKAVQPSAAWAWADTQRAAVDTDLCAPATQIVGDPHAYLDQGDLGRRVTEDQVELFVTGDVAGGLQRELRRLELTYIALHDIGSSGSLRLLGSLAGSAGCKLQRLSVRRQGHGLALAVLQFLELPLPDGTRLRLYSTDVTSEGSARAPVAQTLLAFSRLGVLLVGDLPLNAVSTALHPLRERMQRGVWPNREILLLPVAGRASLVPQGQELAVGSAVAVHVGPRAAKAREVWDCISTAWNRGAGQQQAGPGRQLSPDIAQALPRAQPAAGAGNDPIATALPAASSPRPAGATAPASAGPQPPQPPYPQRPPAGPAGSTPHHANAAHLPPADLQSSGFAKRKTTAASHAHAPVAFASKTPHSAALPAPMPVPGSARWQDYADRCLEVKGVHSACVFDTHTLQPLAHAGGSFSADRLAQQGALLLAEMVDVARALGFGATRPDAAVSLGGHHLLLLQVPGHPGVALHAVLRVSAMQLTAARVQLEQVIPPA